MLSKRQIKYFKSLQLKKYRLQEGLFLVEGAKGVREVLNSGFNVQSLMATQDFLSELDSPITAEMDVYTVKEDVLSQIGSFKNNNAGIAVVETPASASIELPQDGLTLALEDVKDPGNLGTIIRIADWYGIQNIVCSHETVELYNPKVISATMGSFTRVTVHYCNLQEVLGSTDLPIYGALLSGDSIYETQLSNAGIVLMGNESMGLSDALQSLVSNPLKIPGRGGAESLNVAIATAVVLDNFFR